MIIVLKKGAKEEDAKLLLKEIEQHGLQPLYMPGTERVVIGAIGDERILGDINFKAFSFVDEVKPVLSPYKLVSRELQVHDSVVRVKSGLTIGGEKIAIITGPPYLQNEAQLERCAKYINQVDSQFLLTNIYASQLHPVVHTSELGQTGIESIQAQCKNYGLTAIMEVNDEKDLAACDGVKLIKLKPHQMRDRRLLSALSESDKAVILTRSHSATINDLLLSAEYLYSNGNQNIILCESGLRTIETANNTTIDLAAVAFIKSRSHLPVVVELSHNLSDRELIRPMARAAIAAGANGLIIESCPEPDSANFHSPGLLNETAFSQLIRELKPFAEAMGAKLQAKEI